MNELSNEDLTRIIEAIQAALMVGEIHFETCVLSKQVKGQLTEALEILNSL